MKSFNFFPRPWLLAGIAAMLLPETVFGLDPARYPTQYVRDRWGVEKGFPTGRVSAITQTADGYLWIGTDSGLVRFDGLTFKPEQNRGAEDFSLEHVLGLSTDSDGNLWIRLPAPTLVRYKDGRFQSTAMDPDELAFRVNAITRANDGRLLLWSRRNGAIVFHSGKFEALVAAASVPASPVTSMTQAPDGDIWIGTQEKGLIRLQGKRFSTITASLANLTINCLQPAENTELWIGTNEGLFRWNGSGITQAQVPDSLSHSKILALTKDRDSNLWIGTSTGLFRLNAQGLASFRGSHETSKEAVTALFEDREGNLWVGGADGIERIRDSAFVTYSTTDDLPWGNDGPVYAEPQGRIWWSPATRGLEWLWQGRMGTADQADLAKDIVYSIAGGNEELWLGRQKGGLTRLSLRANSFRATTYTTKDGLAQDSVFTVERTRDGTIWAGTLNAGASRFRDGQFTTFTSANGLAANTVNSILEARDGTVWFATVGGLSSLVTNQWRTYGVKDGLPAENVNCLFEDSKGVLWIGTMKGVALLRLGKVVVPRDLPPSLQEQIFGLTADRNGSLWVATANHVVRVSVDKLLQGTLTKNDVREYGLSDGLSSQGGVRRDRSVVADVLGRIWISMSHGLSVIDPVRPTSGSAPTLVHIAGVFADGNAIPFGNSIHLPARQQRIALQYAGVNLSAPELVRYRYKLDGFDRDWNAPVAGNEAVYPRLGPGPYRFHVSATNADGLWNSSEAVVAFDVEPAFFQTLWFQFFVVLMCGAAVIGLYRLRLRQLTTQLNVRFEERLAERTRIACELHDTVVQNMTGLSLQISGLSKVVTAPPSARERLVELKHLAEDCLREARQSVWDLRAHESDPTDLISSLSESGRQFTAGRSIDFVLEVNGESRPVMAQVRRQLLRIGREAMNNAVKHAQPSRIEARLSFSSEAIYLRVSDDGRGFDPGVAAELGGHFGLTTMRERADQIHASFELSSTLGKGSSVEVKVPAPY